MFSADFTKYTIVPGSRGSSIFQSPEELANLCTMSQLTRFAENLGVKIDKSQSKLVGARKVLDSLLVKDTAKTPLPISTLQIPVKKLIKTTLPEGGMKIRIVCRLDVAKAKKLAETTTPLLAQILTKLCVSDGGVINVTKTSFNAAGIETKRGGNAWRNFLWYKSKGYLKEIICV